MRKGFVYVSVGICAFVATSFAGCNDRHEKYADAKRYAIGAFTGDVSAVKRVEIDWIGGSIDVEQSVDGELSFSEETPSEIEAQRACWYLDGSVLRIRYCKSGYGGKIRDGNKHLQVELPAGLGLDVETKRASVTIGQAAFSSLAIESVSGNVSGEKWTCSGTTDIETGSAAVTVGEIKTRSLEIDGGSGDIKIERIYAPQIQVETSGGRIDVGFAEKTEAELESDSGSITARLLSGLGASVRFETRQGKFYCEKAYEKSGGRYDVFGVDGVSRDCPIYVETKNGDLYIQ